MAIASSEELVDFIARDGIVIDKNYMDLLPSEKKVSIPKNQKDLTLYLVLLRVPKEPMTVVTRDSSIGSMQTQNKKGVRFDFTHSITQILLS